MVRKSVSKTKFKLLDNEKSLLVNKVKDEKIIGYLFSEKTKIYHGVNSKKYALPDEVFIEDYTIANIQWMPDGRLSISMHGNYP